MTGPQKRRPTRNRPGEQIAAALLASGPAPCDQCEYRAPCAVFLVACHSYADYVSGVWPPSTDTDRHWRLAEAEARSTVTLRINRRQKGNSRRP
jgi:hypothetical protein